MKGRLGEGRFGGLESPCCGKTVLAPASGPAGGRLRLMPLGGSITQGRAGKAHYRPLLRDLLKRAGADVDSVGHGNRLCPEETPTEGFDRDHEGHRGWRAEEVLAGIGEWEDEAKADAVLMPPPKRAGSGG